MTRAPLTLILIAALSATLTWAQDDPGIAVNPSFEEGPENRAEGWGVGSGAEIVRDPAATHTGERGAKTRFNDPVAQRLAIEGGSAYEISGWIKRVDPAGVETPKIKVYFYDGDGNEVDVQANPIVALDGQTIQISPDRTQLWVCSQQYGLVRYDNPLDGGDRPPALTLTGSGEPDGSFFGRTIWLDRERDILYAGHSQDSSEIVAWYNASQINANRPPDATMRLEDGGPITGLTGDPTANRLFVLRATPADPGVAVIDNADTRNGTFLPDRLMLLPKDSGTAIAYDNLRDLIYVNQQNLDDADIGIIANASNADGPVDPTTVTGANIGILRRVSSMAVIPEGDLLLAQIIAGKLLMFEDASTMEGAVEPARRDDTPQNISIMAWLR
jgi:hypothetical protein